MNQEEDLDERTMTNTDMVKLLISAKNVRAAFVNYIDSELIVVVNDKFKPESLDKARERLPIWLQGILYPKDPSVVFSTSCTKICRISTMKIEGSPIRLLLQYHYLEKIL
jgi:hypothetical protein